MQNPTGKRVASAKGLERSVRHSLRKSFPQASYAMRITRDGEYDDTAKVRLSGADSRVASCLRRDGFRVEVLEAAPGAPLRLEVSATLHAESARLRAAEKAERLERIRLRAVQHSTARDAAEALSEALTANGIDHTTYRNGASVTTTLSPDQARALAQALGGSQR